MGNLCYKAVAVGGTENLPQTGVSCAWDLLADNIDGKTVHLKSLVVGAKAVLFVNLASN